MPDAFGYDASIGWGKESTWGTPAARAKFAEIISESVKKTIERQEAPSTRGRGERRRQSFLEVVDGDIEMEGIYEGVEQLFENLFGTAAVTTTVEAAVAFNHQFTFSDQPLTGLSIEIYRGDDADGTPEAFLYDGCKIVAVTMNFAPNDPVKFTFTIAGREETFVTKTAVTFPDLSGALLIKGHQVSAEIDDVATTIDEAEITIDLGLQTDKRVMGSKFRDEPVPGSSRRTVTGRITADWVDKTQYQKFTAGTVVKLEILATGDNIPGTAAANKYQFNLTLPKIQYDGETPGISDAGIVKQPLPFFALLTGSGTSDQLYLDVQNGLSSV